MENQIKVFIPVPELHFKGNEPHDVYKVTLPLIPLYGRYNPIPRKERVSKVTGLNFSKQEALLITKKTAKIIHAFGSPVRCAKTKDGRKIKLKNYTDHLKVEDYKGKIVKKI